MRGVAIHPIVVAVEAFFGCISPAIDPRAEANDYDGRSSVVSVVVVADDAHPISLVVVACRCCCSSPMTLKIMINSKGP